jgi:hypothetical protein
MPAGRAAELPPGTTITGFWTPDEQLVLTWPAGALPAATVTIEAEPIDPAMLGPLPGGRRPNGNAYAITLSFGAFRAEAGALLRVPEPVDGVYVSDDGHQWQPLVPRSGTAGVGVAAFVSGHFILPSAPTRRSSPLRLLTLPALIVVSVVIGLIWRRRLPRARPNG